MFSGMAEMLYQILILFVPSYLSGKIFNYLLPTYAPVLSSTLSSYQAENAIDGDVLTIAHTRLETTSWFEVKLSGLNLVSMVTVINHIDSSSVHR